MPPSHHALYHLSWATTLSSPLCRCGCPHMLTECSLSSVVVAWIKVRVKLVRQALRPHTYEHLRVYNTAHRVHRAPGHESWASTVNAPFTVPTFVGAVELRLHCCCPHGLVLPGVCRHGYIPVRVCYRAIIAAGSTSNRMPVVRGLLLLYITLSRNTWVLCI